MTSDKTDPSEYHISALEYQNRLLLAQAEALRTALSERNDEITRLSAMLAEKPAGTSHRPGLLQRLRLRLR